ncbi:MAG: PD-(D/E)XK nuclease family protein [Synergistaceae bacterium]|jgi:RecB family exonuclease|nr:PD-(D/E)XK nuclease family protein [Synergistaceae bacterium]
MIRLFSYVKLSALGTELRRERVARGGDIVYMLPSMPGAEYLEPMLRGGGYFGRRPEIWSWQELYNRVTPKHQRRRCIDPPDRRLVLKFVTDQAAAESEPGGAARAVMSGRGFVRMLGEAVREMLLEGVEPDLILPDDGSPDHEMLCRLYGDYLLYLDEHGLADNSDLPSLTRRALDGLPDALKNKTMRWVGFMSFTGAQLNLIRALEYHGADMEFYMPDSGCADFRSAASQLGVDAVPIESSPCAVCRVISPDVCSQFENIAELIMNEYSSMDIGILVDADRMETLAAELNRRKIPWQRRSEVTVDKTALIDAARRIWEAHKLGWPPLRVRYLLRSAPFGIEPDHTEFTRSMPEGMGAWREFFSGNDHALGVLSLWESFCSLLERGGTSEELLGGLMDLSGGGEWERRLASEAGADWAMDAAVRETASARLEIERKLSMTQETGRSLGEAGSLRFAGEAAMNFIRDWAGEAATALSPIYRSAVSVCNFPPEVLASHDIWIMTDVDGTRYPGPSSERALLSEKLRERVNDTSDGSVHLPTMREKLRQKEAMFRRMIAVGERVCVLSRSASASGVQAGESPFVSSLMRSGSDIWKITETRELVPPPLPAVRRGRGVFPRSVRGAFEDKYRISLSHADELMECPFAWWCGRAAFIEPLPDTAGVADRAVLGSAVHDIWRAAVNSYREGGRTLGSVIGSDWDEITDGLTPKYPILADPRALPRVLDLKHRMYVMADTLDEADARAGARGMTRVRIETEMALPEIESEHATFSGRADRVDFWSGPEGEAAVIFDYKLGKSRSYAKTLQLASYGLSLRNSGVDVAGFSYVCLGDLVLAGAWSDVMGPIYKASSRRASCGEKIESASELLKEIDRIAAGGVFEANYGSARCGYCGYATLCRRSERGGDYDEEDDGPDDGE